MPEASWSYLGRVPWLAARQLQESLAALCASGEVGDHLLLLEHDPVWTVGRSAGGRSLASTREWVRTNRGGGPTYHGPGQLVGYPVLRLRGGGRRVRELVGRFEKSIVAVSASVGVTARAIDGLPGVWIGDPPGRKLASIGLAVRRGVTLHGFALNVELGSEAGFAGFDACGLDGVRVSSLEREAGHAIPDLPEIAARMAVCLGAELGSRFLEVPPGEIPGHEALAPRGLEGFGRVR